MARRPMGGGHGVVAYATDPGAVRQITHEGALGAMSLDELVERLAPPRAVWLMVPAGQEHTFAERVLSAMRHRFGGHVEPPSGG